jgi:hypothetical protein
LKRTLLLLAAIVFIGAPVTTFADTFTFAAPPTAPNQGAGGPNQFDLDHHSAYTWRIDNVNLMGKTITGATLTFKNMSNWDTNPNMLFVHLLDSAKNAGISSFIDASGSPVPSSQIADNFAGSLYSSNPLVNAGTASVLLASRSFTTVATTFTITFTASQLQALNSYFQNGNNVAFGIDPDCHFWNNGIVFQFNTEPSSVPEPMTLTLLGTAMAGLYLKRRRRKAAMQTQA